VLVAQEQHRQHLRPAQMAHRQASAHLFPPLVAVGVVQLLVPETPVVLVVVVAVLDQELLLVVREPLGKAIMEAQAPQQSPISVKLLAVAVAMQLEPMGCRAVAVPLVALVQQTSLLVHQLLMLVEVVVVDNLVVLVAQAVAVQAVEPT
jgi:hypothetical protein